MSDESCFATDTVFHCEDKKTISYRRLKILKHSVSIGLHCSGSSFHEHFNSNLMMHFFKFKTIKCFSVKRFYANTLLFFVLLGTAFALKKSNSYFLVLSLYSTKNLKEKIFRVFDRL